MYEGPDTKSTRAETQAELDRCRFNGRWMVRERKMPVASRTQAYGYHLLALRERRAEVEESAKGREIFGENVGVIATCQHSKAGHGAR